MSQNADYVPTCSTCGTTLMANGDCPRNGQYGDEAPEHIAIDEAEAAHIDSSGKEQA